MTSPTAVPRSPAHFLNVGRLVMPMKEQSEYEGDEEGNRVDDAKDPGCEQHTAILLQISC